MVAGEKHPILVLGIGNILLKDEGIGVHTIRELEKQDLPATVELVDGGTAGADLLEILADRQQVIVIDAVRGGHPPGTVIQLTPEDLARKPCPGLSLHDVTLVDTLGMLQQIDAAPGRVLILGVVPADLSPGLGLTGPVAKVIPEIVNLVCREIDRLQAGGC